MADLKLSETLNNLYYNPKNEASFSGIDKLYIAAKRIHNQIKREDVKNWLQNQLVYSLHKPIRKKFRRNPVVAEAP